jgi:hypothetical protein
MNIDRTSAGTAYAIRHCTEAVSKCGYSPSININIIRFEQTHLGATQVPVLDLVQDIIPQNYVRCQ